MKTRKILIKIGIITAVAMIGCVLVGNPVWASADNCEPDENGVMICPQKEYECATILKAFCDTAEDNGEQTIKDMITFVIVTLSMGIGVLATIGIIFCGYLIMTARDNEQQLSKAKKRLLEIIIGIVIWAIGAAGVLLLVPDEEAANNLKAGSVIKVEVMK